MCTLLMGSISYYCHFYWFYSIANHRNCVAFHLQWQFLCKLKWCNRPQWYNLEFSRSKKKKNYRYLIGQISGCYIARLLRFHCFNLPKWRRRSLLWQLSVCCVDFYKFFMVHWLRKYCIFYSMLIWSNEKHLTVRTILKSNQKIIETLNMSIFIHQYVRPDML